MGSKLKAALWASAIIIIVIAGLTLLESTKREPVSVRDIRHSQVNVTTEDSLQLQADLFMPVFKDEKRHMKVPGLVMLGPFLESRAIYQRAAVEFARYGICVLTVDLRHSGAGARGVAFQRESIANLPLDAKAALEFIRSRPDIDSQRLAILGTGVSARAAVLGAGADPAVKAAVLVSAVLDSSGLAVIRESDFRPIFVLVSTEDGPAGVQARDIFEASQNGRSRIESFFNAGSGSQLWRIPPVAEEMTHYIAEWLSEQLM